MNSTHFLHINNLDVILENDLGPRRRFITASAVSLDGDGLAREKGGVRHGFIR